MVTNLDKFGRIIIPKKLREKLGITSETTLNLADDGDRIIIEPINNDELILEKDGIFVFTGKMQEDLDKFLESDRKLRLYKLLS